MPRRSTRRIRKSRKLVARTLGTRKRHGGCLDGKCTL
jgi:hypothetical protein